MIFVGIDPGKSGAIAWIGNGFVSATPFPFVGDELAVWEIASVFDTECCAALEKVHAMPKQGVVSVFTFGQGYGEIRGMLKLLKIPFSEPTPQAWKKLILAGMDWKGRKECSIEYVMKRYPSVNLFPGKKRVAHDGMADAICLAEYARRTYKAEDDWSK